MVSTLPRPALTLISSMATRTLLAQLLAVWEQRAGRAVAFEAVGGVEVARRVQAGESFDAVVLAADAIDQLIGSGQLLAGSRVDLLRSGVAACVRAGTPQPDIGSEAALRQAVLAAASIGYSTGPSGIALMRLFERWGIAGEIAGRTVQAPPGVPVGALVARGEVALGFQQLSELMHLEGIAVIGPLPEAVQITTVFSGAIGSASSEAAAVRDLLAFLAGPDATAAKQSHGMAPA